MHTWMQQRPASYVAKQSRASPIAFIKATTRSRLALSLSIYARIAATILYKEHQTNYFPHQNQHALRQEATVTTSSEWLLRPVWYQFSILLLCLYSLLHSVGHESSYKPPLSFFQAVLLAGLFDHLVSRWFCEPQSFFCFYLSIDRWT